VRFSLIAARALYKFQASGERGQIRFINHVFIVSLFYRAR
jgi:hypothetical protein